MDEAEVQHLIGLVEHENFELAQCQRALVDKIKQTAWGGDENVESASDGAHALRVGNSAEDHADREPHEAAIGFGALGDLRGEFACRRKHQHAHMARFRERFRRREPVERRQHESRGLAGSGLGDAEQITAGQDRRNRLALDRRRRRVIGVRKRIEDGLREPERSKRQNGIP